MLLLEPRTLDHFTQQPRPAAPERPDAELRRQLNLLSKRDRLLVELSMMPQLSRRQVGMAVNLSPGSVTRKLRQIMNRLHDPLVRELCDPTCTLAPDHREVAIEYFLQRDSMMSIARRHGYTHHDVRAMLQYVRGWYRGISGLRRR